MESRHQLLSVSGSRASVSLHQHLNDKCFVAFYQLGHQVSFRISAVVVCLSYLYMSSSGYLYDIIVYLLLCMSSWVSCVCNMSTTSSLWTSPEARELGLLTGTISTDQFVGPYLDKTIADLYQDVSQGGIYVNLHNKENPQVCHCPYKS
jgi:hypothetical protein